jgi:hypothetical protein|tara:strand:+ start:50 stop:634 length:585 start_codon:yes stop_codon:yes gene_type:complete
MSNIEHSKAIIDAVLAVVGEKIKGEDAVDRKFKLLNDTGFKWTDAISPTPNNLDLGKSTTSKEAFLQLKVAVSKKLKAKKRDYSTTAIGSEVIDIKNGLMRFQDPELFAATEGVMSKIAKVELNGKAILNETAIKFDPETATPAQISAEVEKKAEQGAKNYLAFIEKNKDALGETYATKRNAVITMMETSGYKR